MSLLSGDRGNKVIPTPLFFNWWSSPGAYLTPYRPRACIRTSEYKQAHSLVNFSRKYFYPSARYQSWAKWRADLGPKRIIHFVSPLSVDLIKMASPFSWYHLSSPSSSSHESELYKISRQANNGNALAKEKLFSMNDEIKEFVLDVIRTQLCVIAFELNSTTKIEGRHNPLWYVNFTLMET